ncbi:hypothetical protein B0T11DRAFT_355254 [Plectosphaerella cucumerina]|uniref:Uncharacterized protein n=1 Tax=Plectosphaerella cucumerina TaxID=40658 RepID=A0A8K0THF3_9PEZI|nr:hypothetical protein B0T11DRAFT_355254 [Plectosphaerella cucumerina]
MPYHAENGSLRLKRDDLAVHDERRLAPQPLRPTQLQVGWDTSGFDDSDDTWTWEAKATIQEDCPEMHQHYMERASLDREELFGPHEEAQAHVGALSNVTAQADSACSAWRLTASLMWLQQSRHAGASPARVLDKTTCDAPLALVILPAVPFIFAVTTTPGSTLACLVSKGTGKGFFRPTPGIMPSSWNRFCQCDDCKCIIWWQISGRSLTTYSRDDVDLLLFIGEEQHDKRPSPNRPYRRSSIFRHLARPRSQPQHHRLLDQAALASVLGWQGGPELLIKRLLFLPPRSMLASQVFAALAGLESAEISDENFWGQRGIFLSMAFSTLLLIRRHVLQEKTPLDVVESEDPVWAWAAGWDRGCAGGKVLDVDGQLHQVDEALLDLLTLENCEVLDDRDTATGGMGAMAGDEAYAPEQVAIEDVGESGRDPVFSGGYGRMY